MASPAEDIEPATPALSPLLLESRELALTIQPGLGGKTTSLVTKRNGAEWLHPPLRPYSEASPSGGFELSDGGGFDECLPTVAASGVAPDHGELWRQPWHGGVAGNSVHLTTESRHPRLHVARTATLSGHTVSYQYTVSNPETAPAEFLWSAHPLLAVEEGDSIILPPEVRSLRVEYSAGGRLPGPECAWPLATDNAGNSVDLSRVGPRDGRTAEKLFTGPLTGEGWCALYRPRLQGGIVLRFHAAIVPYVGLWICHGAWPAGGASKQYTVALEPTTANCDALEAARENGTVTTLEPGGTLRWTLDFAVLGSDHPMDYQTFCGAAAGKHA